MGRWPSAGLHPAATFWPVRPRVVGLESPFDAIANLQKMAFAERREAEPTTQHRNEVGLAV